MTLKMLLRESPEPGYLPATEREACTVFRKTRQHNQSQIDRAVRAQKTCERDHRAPVMETCERQV